MTPIDFIQRLLGRQKPSGTLARERLQLVLAHDRSDLNPELLEQMRREILEVVQRYVEIDLDSGDVSLETGDRITALVANLPILRTRREPPVPSNGRAVTPETDAADTPAGNDIAASEAPCPDAADGPPLSAVGGSEPPAGES